MARWRIDKLLTDLGRTKSRRQAQLLIERRAVTIEREGHLPWTPTKVSETVELSDLDEARKQMQIRISNDDVTRFVSRAGLKLDAALERVGARVEDLTALDVGQSTGGFTDCLLQRGIQRVVGVDVGTGQLAPELRGHPQVRVFEKINARELPLETLFQANDSQAFDWAVVDVSFISLEKVLPEVIRALKPGAKVLSLVKPQFEVGPEGLGKGGIVRDSGLYAQVQGGMTKLCADLGFEVLDYFPSAVPGADGNQEFFIYAEKTDSDLTRRDARRVRSSGTSSD